MRALNPLSPLGLGWTYPFCLVFLAEAGIGLPCSAPSPAWHTVGPHSWYCLLGTTRSPSLDCFRESLTLKGFIEPYSVLGACLARFLGIHLERWQLPG